MSADLERELADASELVAATPGDDQLAQLRELAQQLLVAARRIEMAQELLALAQAAYLRLSDREIPTKLQSLGLKKLELDSGVEVTLKDFVNPSIDKDQADVAFTWLTDHGLGDLIKNTVIVSFGRGEDEDAAELVSDLVTDGYEPEQKKNVHPASLAASIREHLEKGGVVDTDSIKVFTGTTTKIKLPKNTTLRDILGK
jgi:hypothetical protein